MRLLIVLFVARWFLMLAGNGLLWRYRQSIIQVQLAEYHVPGSGISRTKDIRNLFIFVDPFAKGFYDKIGAGYLYDSMSSIPGRSTLAPLN
jgi:hypothetical protein